MTLSSSATPPIRLAVLVFLGLCAPPLHAQTPDFPTQSVDVDGITTTYHAAGLDSRRPGQPVVVFQSGGGTPLERWAAVLAGLEDRAAVLAYDRPGIGGTSLSEEPLTLALVSEHLHDLLEILDIAPPYVLVGHSWGGPLILDYALRYPDEVVGSIHVDPSTFLMADQDHMTVVMRSARVSYAEADSIMKAFEEEWEQSGGFSTDHLPPGLAAESDLMREYSQTSPHADIPPPAHPITVLLALRPMAPPPFPESMDPLEWFRVERQFTRNQFEEWLDDQPDSSVRLLPESTHEVPQKAPEAIVEAIDTMLQVIRSEPGRQDPGAPQPLAGQEVRARDLGVPYM
jgi:pimeloyl-ACP methyl ester carboxylesterase